MSLLAIRQFGFADITLGLSDLFYDGNRIGKDSLILKSNTQNYISIKTTITNTFNNNLEIRVYFTAKWETDQPIDVDMVYDLYHKGEEEDLDIPDIENEPITVKAGLAGKRIKDFFIDIPAFTLNPLDYFKLVIKRNGSIGSDLHILSIAPMIKI